MSNITIRLDELEARVLELEKNTIKIPKFIPKYKPAICPKCKRDISSGVGYVCNDIECPIGLGPAYL